MKLSAFKKAKFTHWTTDQLVHLSKSIGESCGASEVSDRKVESTSWDYQQLLDMSAAKAFPFI